MDGIALPASDLPLVLLERVTPRIHRRGEHDEVRFLRTQSPRCLPVELDGRLQLVAWGARKPGVLPTGCWIEQDRLEGGIFQYLHPEPVVIPATLGFHKGVWFLINEGIRGVVVRDAEERPVVYMVVVPSTNYYRNMTEQSRTMPLLIDQVI